MPLGEASVVIQVVMPHRAASLEACRHLIERLKHELPVWKREVWEGGADWGTNAADLVHASEVPSAPGQADS